MDGPVSTFNSTFINDFGISLFTEVFSGSNPVVGGIFISPASIMLALALLLNGASPGSVTFWQLLGCMTGLNMCKSNFAQTFNVSTPTASGLSPNAFDRSINNLLDTNAVLQDLVTQMRISAVNEVDLKILNSMWLKRPYQFAPPYTRSIEQYINGYAHSAENAQQINSYVEAAFKGQIKSVISSTEFSAVDVGLLVNAVYFKSAWASKFSTSNTNRGSFISSEKDKPILCNMMHRAFNQYAAEYFGSPGSHQAIRIPLSGRGFNVIVIRPSNKSSVAAAAQMLREGKMTWSRPAGGVNVAMPRFNVTTLAGLRSPLKTLGISEVFDPTAAQMDAMVTKLSGGLRPPYVDAFSHVVGMNVNEDGAETQPIPLLGPMVSGGFGGTLVAPIPITFDRPFVFAIQHKRTGALVFLGAVTQPSPYVERRVPLLTAANTATVVHGAAGEATALEGPMATSPGSYTASNPLHSQITTPTLSQITSSPAATSAVAHASVRGEQSRGSPTSVGQSLLDVIISSESSGEP